MSFFSVSLFVSYFIHREEAPPETEAADLAEGKRGSAHLAAGASCS
jgi:hypothetical protein